MPVPNTKGNPPRIVIQYAEPTVDAGRYPAKRVVGDTVRVTADVFRDGHEILRAVVRYRGPGSRRWVESPMRPIDAHVNGVRWEGEFPVDVMGRWQWSIEAWSDVFATWRDELQRKIAAAQEDLAGELSEGVVLLEQAAGRAKGADKKTIEAALAVLKDPASPTDSALAPDLFAAMERASERTGACQLDTPHGDRGRPRRRRLRLLVRAVPALVGRAQGGREADPRDLRARLRRPLLPAHPPDRREGAQGPQQHAHRRPRRPRLAVRDRRQGGRPRRRAPRARHARRRPRRSARPPASTAWTSRSTSRSTPRPTTRG